MFPIRVLNSDNHGTNISQNICTRSSLIQTILSVPESHRFGCFMQFTDYTVGREYALSQHPAPKNSYFFLRHYCMHYVLDCQLFFVFFLLKLINTKLF